MEIDLRKGEIRFLEEYIKIEPRIIRLIEFLNKNQDVEVSEKEIYLNVGESKVTPDHPDYEKRMGTWFRQIKKIVCDSFSNAKLVKGKEREKRTVKGLEALKKIKQKNRLGELKQTWLRMFQFGKNSSGTNFILFSPGQVEIIDGDLTCSFFLIFDELKACIDNEEWVHAKVRIDYVRVLQDEGKINLGLEKAIELLIAKSYCNLNIANEIEEYQDVMKGLRVGRKEQLEKKYLMYNISELTAEGPLRRLKQSLDDEIHFDLLALDSHDSAAIEEIKKIVEKFLGDEWGSDYLDMKKNWEEDL